MSQRFCQNIPEEIIENMILIHLPVKSVARFRCVSKPWQSLLYSQKFCPCIPEVITENILIRLPVKSVGRFRCVSNPWRSLLSSPQFCRYHLNFHKKHEPAGAIIWREKPFALWISDLANGSSLSEAALPLALQGMDGFVTGSCRGLVLVEHQSVIEEASCRKLILFNPATLDTVEIPKFDKISRNIYYGLGYDSSEDDYKIVSYEVYNPVEGVGVHVYSVRMKTWRFLGKFPYVLFSFGARFVNGCIHWLGTGCYEAYDDTRLVIAYNFALDKFEEVPLPSELYNRDISGLQLDALEGCLVLSDTIHYGLLVFWVMKEYGVQDSWTKHSLRLPDEYEFRRPRVCGVWGEDELVLETPDKELVAFNWRNGDSRSINGISSKTAVTMTFRETLESPNYI